MTDGTIVAGGIGHQPILAEQLACTIKLVAGKQARRIVSLSLDDARAEGVDFTTLVNDHPAVGTMLAGLADHAPYLWRLIRHDWSRSHALLTQPPAQALERILTATDQAWRHGAEASDPATEAEVMRRLRRLKQDIALLIALCDLGGIWSVEQVTAALSDFADRSLNASLRCLLALAGSDGRITTRCSARRRARRSTSTRRGGITRG